MTTIPRPEHPFPQMERENWRNLNGEWQFAFDFGDSGIEQKWYEKKGLDKRITVPFCPESELSGIGYKDFMPAVWYQRNITICREQLADRVLLHFGAVDYESHVYVNGKEAGVHKGGYSSFVFDITSYLQEGDNLLTVCARDDTRSAMQPSGKQCERYGSYGCMYTRTTGIWQTVWLEFVPRTYIKGVRYYPNIADGTMTIEARLQGKGVLRAEAFYEGEACGQAQVKVETDRVQFTLQLSQLHLWEAGQGRLYDLRLSFEEDRVKSYFGMRSLQLDGERFLINGKSVFQRLVLDQGFYPDGIYTAPTEEALVRDIRLSLAAGFNGARLHEKMFEPRFLYHCDRLGYLVWGEHANWGLDLSDPAALHAFLPEWMETLERDFNHPAIVGWCPFNETWDYAGRKQYDDTLAMVYRVTKQYDVTRPCIDTSGNFHVLTDIYDLHDYTQEPEEFAKHYESFARGEALQDTHPFRQKPVAGIPVFISEYGGIKWDVEGVHQDSWGYGNGPKTEAEFIERYRGLTDALLDNVHMFGFCYTQLYDVEQETNGLYTYSREPKFDMVIFKEINSRKAAIEDESR